MQLVKKTAEYTVYQKRSEKYAVRSNLGTKPWVNGNDKVKILVEEGLLKVPMPVSATPEAEAPAEEAAEEKVAEATEASPAEDTTETDDASATEETTGEGSEGTESDAENADDSEESS